MQCLICQTEFAPKRSWQKYCSQRCNNKSKHWSSDQQREWVSGNWYRYFNRLVVSSKDRKTLSVQDLLDLLDEQGGRCALTGVKLTNILLKNRKTWTNASVDRIVSGGPYIRSNIQLVCTAVNGFRLQMSIEEFKQWCQLVAKFRGLPNGKKLQRRIQSVSRQARAEEKPRPKKRGAARVDAGGTSAEGRRQRSRSRQADTQRRLQRPLEPPRNFKK